MGSEAPTGAPHPPDPPLINRLRGTFGAETIFDVLFKQTWMSYCWKSKLNNMCFEKGQTILLNRSGSKFCVEPRSQSPNISYMSQIPI